MSLVDIPGGMWWPGPPNAYQFGLDSSQFVIDAVDERSALIFQAPKAGDISGLKFRTKTVTTGATVTVGLYSLDTSGQPDIASGALATKTLVVDAADDNMWLSSTLDTPLTVARGQIMSMVISQPSSSAGSMQIMTTSGSASTSWAGAFPYGALYVPSTWSKSGTLRPLFLAEYASSGGIYPLYGRGNYYHPLDNTATPISSIQWNSGSAQKEYGIIFTPTHRMKVDGAWIQIFHGTLSDYYIKIYSDPLGTPSEMATSPLIKGGYAPTGGSQSLEHVMLTSEATFEAGQKYAITIKPDTANNITLYKTTITSAGIENSEAGSSFYGGFRAAGAFTEESTTRYFMGLHLTAMDNGLGAGRATLAIGV